MREDPFADRTRLVWDAPMEWEKNTAANEGNEVEQERTEMEPPRLSFLLVERLKAVRQFGSRRSKSTGSARMSEKKSRTLLGDERNVIGAAL
jgi:hypothetical protein